MFQQQVTLGRFYRRPTRKVVIVLASVMLIAGSGVASAVTIAPITGLLYSADASHASPKRIAHASISGSVNLFIGGATTNVAAVDYFIDDPLGAGAPKSQPAEAPFDFVMSTAALTPGTHNVLAVLTTTGGIEVDLFARFAVGSGTFPGDPPPTATTATTLTGGTATAATPTASGAGTGTGAATGAETGTGTGTTTGTGTGVGTATGGGTATTGGATAPAAGGAGIGTTPATGATGGNTTPASGPTGGTGTGTTGTGTGTGTTGTGTTGTGAGAPTPVGSSGSTTGTGGTTTSPSTGTGTTGTGTGTAGTGGGIVGGGSTTPTSQLVTGNSAGAAGLPAPGTTGTGTTGIGAPTSPTATPVGTGGAIGEGGDGPVHTPTVPSLCQVGDVNNEPQIIAGYAPASGQTVGAGQAIKVWVTDENPPFIAPGEVVNTTTGVVTTPGDRNALAPDGYRWEPSLYILPNSAEAGGIPFYPTSIHGQVNPNPPTRSDTGTVIAGMDPAPAGADLSEEWNSEYVWDVNGLGLAAGTYSAEFLIFDGDRDRGVGCISITITGTTAAAPTATTPAAPLAPATTPTPAPVPAATPAPVPAAVTRRQ